jgi:cation diffusion facilitator CzcD-associated flavoprotein CzcO
MEVRVAIIGAGLGGIAAAVKLKKAGINSFALFERAAGPGGVWYHNTYPGCEVDVPSKAYSYSFMPYDWSGTYAKQPELAQYVQDVVARFALAPHIRYNTLIGRARWNELTGTYVLETSDGRSYEAELCVSAVGLLSNPKRPDWPGLDLFSGACFHAAEFDHDIPLDQKTVAIVGTGSSACQIAPLLAPRVRQLYVFQREPGHVLPKKSVSYAGWARPRYSRSPVFRRVERSLELQRAVRKARAINPATPDHARVERYFDKYLSRTVTDPVTRAGLHPDYPYACKDRSSPTATTRYSTGRTWNSFHTQSQRSRRAASWTPQGQRDTLMW